MYYISYSVSLARLIHTIYLSTYTCTYPDIKYFVLRSCISCQHYMTCPLEGMWYQFCTCNCK